MCDAGERTRAQKVRPVGMRLRTKVNAAFTLRTKERMPGAFSWSDPRITFISFIPEKGFKKCYTIHKGFVM